MQLLTKADYESRLAQLTEEQSLAETDHRRAALALEVGSGNEAAVRKAQAHVERIAGRIAGLHGAWEESQRLAAQQDADVANDAYAELVSAVDEQLVKRQRCLANVRILAVALAASMAEFDEAVPAIRRMLAGRPEMRNGLVALEHSMDIGQAAGTVIAELGIAPSRICASERSAESFVQREEKFADAILSWIARLAPAKAEPVAPDPAAPPPGMYDYAQTTAKGVPSGFDAAQGGE
ncbi:hypothetical protein [Novosphingobium naphthalenivorans]|uniref:hypothetical protein n=1 Tax=Novosphingobium naphthalenivorans TaxID=273168 RepID=UPI000AACAF37|nr:hypothetical protein [Novosphingobium naphthalenivorans]